MILDFTGRTALVTGAARGIGLATATALAGRGAHVALVDVADPSGLRKPEGSVMSISATLAPRSASADAIARPMPLAASVTRAVRPFNSSVTLSPCHVAPRQRPHGRGHDVPRGHAVQREQLGRVAGTTEDVGDADAR